MEDLPSKDQNWLKKVGQIKDTPKQTKKDEEQLDGNFIKQSWPKNRYS